MNLPSLAVITPTFNRDYLLPRLYNSLKTLKFITQWILVDDGSTDSTTQVFNTMITESPEHLTLTYIKRPNFGMACALNAAFPLLESEYFCKVDSDDYFSSNFKNAYEDVFTSVLHASEEHFYHCYSMACISPSQDKINTFNGNAKKHTTLKNAYIIKYASQRLYEQELGGDLLDIFPSDPAKYIFRFPYLLNGGYCPSGILHMFYAQFYPERLQLFYNSPGLHKDYLDSGVSKQNIDSLTKNPKYYLFSALNELSLPNHNKWSLIKSIKTFTRALTCLCLGAISSHFNNQSTAFK